MSPAVIAYRVSRRLHLWGLKRTSRTLDWLNRLTFAGWVPGSASIGRDVKLGYLSLGIVIHSDARIGDSCTIAQNVTIGTKHPGGPVPVIGNHVYLGAGCVVLGGVRIGDNVTIGANSVVTTDIPDGSIAVGIPAKVLGKIERAGPES
ncbi:MAG: serine acetyltransferase [Opitutus sp.]|nr:serine acetyltransferase [Opitutus sp.]